MSMILAVAKNRLLNLRRDRAARRLDDVGTQERLREIEASDEPGLDRKLWSALAEAGLLGVALPESAGGPGFGLLGASRIPHRVGRTPAPAPSLPLFPATSSLPARPAPRRS